MIRKIEDSSEDEYYECVEKINGFGDNMYYLMNKDGFMIIL